MQSKEEIEKAYWKGYTKRDTEAQQICKQCKYIKKVRELESREQKLIEKLENRIKELNNKSGGNTFHVQSIINAEKRENEEILKRKIKDRKLLWLTRTILLSTEGMKGLPLGNYASQMFANIYLNDLDQYAKHKLKCKFYFRYMDDIVILCENKEIAQKRLKILTKFIEENLDLTFNTKISDGTKVIQEIKRLKPEIIILDLKMPGRNGLQIIEDIENDDSIETKVVVFSGEMDYIS